MTQATKKELVDHVHHLQHHLDRLIASHADLREHGREVDLEWSRRIEISATVARHEPMDRRGRGPLLEQRRSEDV